ncbi:hypothetical protein CEW92_17905 [Bacillaceae bacterium SAS-127]|nr:hypothetical protein CEW92_17905 [Bacillaceae bacterium SAS-127]
MIKSRKLKLYSAFIAILLILFVVIIYVNNNKNNSVAPLDTLDSSENSIILFEVTPEGDGIYLSKQATTDDQYELLKERMEREGWTYTHQDGNGLFFKKGDKQIIVETKIWRSEYIKYDIPNNVANIAD